MNLIVSWNGDLLVATTSQVLRYQAPRTWADFGPGNVIVDSLSGVVGIAEGSRTFDTPPLFVALGSSIVRYDNAQEIEVVKDTTILALEAMEDDVNTFLYATPTDRGIDVYSSQTPQPVAELVNATDVQILFASPDTDQDTDVLLVSDTGQVLWLENSVVFADDFVPPSFRATHILRDADVPGNPTVSLSATVGNIDGNELPDILISQVRQAPDGTQTDDLSWLENIGNRRFQTHLIASDRGIFDSVLADTNLDGAIDVIASGREGVRSFRNASLTFAHGFLFRTKAPSEPGLRWTGLLEQRWRRIWMTMEMWTSWEGAKATPY